MANIRTAGKSGFIVRDGRKRRETLWFGIGENSMTLAAANSQAFTNSVQVAGLLALRPFTVVRIHWNWFLKSDQTGALEDYQTALGVAVVSDQAAIIGITAVPTPFLDLNSDLWMLHAVQAGSFIFISGVGVDPQGGVVKQLESKAMRKVEDGQDMIFVGENSGVSNGTTSLTAGRMLLKLH